MPLDLPNLDDRRYTDLVEEARRLIPVYDAKWTNHNPSDPGITLVELFAYLTEMLLYRLDRVTAANQRKFLKLLNGPDWTPGTDLNADIRSAVLALRARERGVTAADFERLATDDFNHWLAAMKRAEQDGTPFEEWWQVTRLDRNDGRQRPSAVPAVSRAACVASRNLERGNPTERDADAAAHASLIVLAQMAAALTVARSAHTTTLLENGNVLVSGGLAAAGALVSAERYDPAANTWSAAGVLAIARSAHTATLLPDGKVLVSGGVAGTGALAGAERYDPSANTWSAAATLGTARSAHTATLLPNGKVLVSGGVAGTGALASADLYDPGANTWSAAGSLATARSAHTAVLLAGGKVLVVGGSDGATVLDNVERYDPNANSWSAVAALATARTAHAATILASGKVLVVGGASGANALASVELYDPDAGVLQPPAALKAALWGYLDERRTLTTRHHVVGPRYAPISAEIVVATASGALIESVRERVVQQLERFLHPLTGGTAKKGWPFGRDVYASELYEQIEAVDGVDYVTDLLLSSICLPTDTQCVVAPPLWHAGGDFVGLSLAAHQLPLARFDVAALALAPHTSFLQVQLKVTLTASAPADEATLKRRVKAVVRKFFHPLSRKLDPLPPNGTGLKQADLQAYLQAALEAVPGVANSALAWQAEEARLYLENGQIAGLYVSGDEMVNWQVQIVVQAA